ncbi:MAG: hypothetical protein WCO33_05150 [bacterium]
MRKVLLAVSIFMITAISLIGVFNTPVNADTALQKCSINRGKPAINCIYLLNDGKLYQEVILKKGIVIAYGKVMNCKTPNYPIATNCSYINTRNNK